MPNIASAKKRVVQAEKRRKINVTRKTALKTAIKKTLAALEGNDLQKARELLRDAQAKLARAKGKRVIHRNTASRKISRLAKKVAAAAKPVAE